MPLEQQLKIYADPAFRTAFKEELKLGRKWNSKGITVFKVSNPKLKHYEGTTIGFVPQEPRLSPPSSMQESPGSWVWRRRNRRS